MPYDPLYLGPRKTTTDPYTGETVVCSDDNGDQHKHPISARDFDFCEACGDVVLLCTRELRCISCCSCGAYHSMDCGWPL